MLLPLDCSLIKQLKKTNLLKKEPKMSTQILIDQTRLFFKNERSDKVYEIEISQVDQGQYIVNFRYGRRNVYLNEGTKTPLAVSLEAAEKIYKNVIYSKIKKGYKR